MAKYQGWKNYETWNVALWIGNDAGMYEWANEMAEEAEDKYELADQLKEWYTSTAEDGGFIPDDLPGPVQDLLNGALAEVDWREVAEGILSD